MAGMMLQQRPVLKQHGSFSLRTVSAFTGIRPHRCRCFAPVTALQQTSQPDRLPTQRGTLGRLRLLLTSVPVAVPLYLATYLPAAAEEDATVDAAFTAASQSAGATDLLVSVLAGIVLVLLVVVTAGVAYLNLKSFFDDRQEKEDQKGPKLVSSVSASGSSSSDDDDDEAPRRVRVTRDKSRGFGRN